METYLLWKILWKRVSLPQVLNHSVHRMSENRRRVQRRRGIIASIDARVIALISQVSGGGGGGWRQWMRRGSSCRGLGALPSPHFQQQQGRHSGVGICHCAKRVAEFELESRSGRPFVWHWSRRRIFLMYVNLNFNAGFGR